jgi:hypothetical protein
VSVAKQQLEDVALKVTLKCMRDAVSACESSRDIVLASECKYGRGRVRLRSNEAEKELYDMLNFYMQRGYSVPPSLALDVAKEYFIDKHRR